MTLIEHIQDIHFSVINVKKLLQKRVVWGRTFSLWMEYFSSSATNAHSRWKLKHILTILEGKDPNTSCVMTCLLTNSHCKAHGNYTWHGQLTKYKEPISSMCTECGKTDTTKVEVDKHIMFHTREKQLSCDQCGKAFKQICFLQQHTKTLTGEKTHICKFCEKTITIKLALRKYGL